MTVALASLIFICCQFVKALRIYFVLGEYRVKLVYLFVLSNLGIVFSYLIWGGIVSVYEIVVVAGLVACFTTPLFASCYSLLILRLFDSIVLFAVVPLLGINVSNKFFLLICLLVVISWSMVSTLPVIMNRLEKRILISNFPPEASLQSLKQLVTLKKQLNLLSFARRGSVSMLIMLTFLIWGLESLSLSVLYGDFGLGVNAVFSRIAGSLGIVPVESFDEYNTLIYMLVIVTSIVAICSFAHLILKGAGK